MNDRGRWWIPRPTNSTFKIRDAHDLRIHGPKPYQKENTVVRHLKAVSGDRGMINAQSATLYNTVGSLKGPIVPHTSGTLRNDNELEPIALQFCSNVR